MEFIAGFLVGIAALPAFWLIFAVVALILSAFVVNERGGWSTIFTIGLGVLIAAKWQLVMEYPIIVAAAIPSYLVLGVIWSRFKWSRLLSAKLNKFLNIRNGFLLKRGISMDVFKQGLPAVAADLLAREAEETKKKGVTIDKRTPEEQEKLQRFTQEKLLAEYAMYVRERLGRYEFNDEIKIEHLSDVNRAVAPLAVNNKGSIVMWIAYWPVTALWYLCADIVTDIAKGLYNMVGGHFQKMSTEKFNDA